MTPSAKAKAAGAPVQVDIGDLQPGKLLKIEWARQARLDNQAHTRDDRNTG